MKTHSIVVPIPDDWNDVNTFRLPVRPYHDCNRWCWQDYPCGKPKCSKQCRDSWARRWSSIIQHSHRERPVTHWMTINLSGLTIGDDDETYIVQSFLAALRRRNVEYLCVNEWSPGEGKRHQHVLLQSPHDLTTKGLRPVLAAAILKRRTPHPLDKPAQLSVSAPANPVGAIRYVFKDIENESKKMLPPPWWRGRVIYGPTKGFLIRPSADLWVQVKAAWYGDKAL